MPRPLFAHLLPVLAPAEAFAGSAAVVIDILRASTTIATALAHGAARVVPCLEVPEALALRADQPPGDVLLGGERGGVRIEGFDFGNSPSEYTIEKVRGKTIGFTTTNGTKALRLAERADAVYMGAFVTGSAVVAAILDAPSVQLLCAGTNGEISREDVLFAGWIVARLLERADDWQLNDQALLALSAIKSVAAINQRLAPGGDDTSLVSTLRFTQGGRNLAKLGLLADLFDAAAVDRFDFAPRFDPMAKAFLPPPS